MASSSRHSSLQPKSEARPSAPATGSAERALHAEAVPAPAVPLVAARVLSGADDDDSVAAHHARLLGDPRLSQSTGQVQRLRLIRQLQRGYGNAHVMRVVERVRRTPGEAVIQRDCPPPAVERPPVAPQKDPDFKAAKAKVDQTAKQEKQHTPAPAKATQTQAAAVGPTNEVASQAKAGQVEKMGQQEPGAFDKKAFVAAVRAAIEAATPKNLEEAEEYKSSGKATQVKGQVGALVGSNKEAAERAIKTTTNEAPDLSKAKPKTVTPAKPETVGPPPGPVGAGQAMPDPKAPAETDLRHDQCATEAQMKEAGVTEEQLQKSNEPQFKSALDAKKEADVHTAEAPKDFKAQEKKVLGDAKAQATGAAAGGLAGMHGGRTLALGKVAGQQAAGKAADEAKRAQVAADLETIYAKAKQEVTAILDGIEGKINPVFDAGEKAAREAMEAYIETETKEFTRKRSLLDLVIDWFSKPPELDAIVDRGVKEFLRRMDAVINQIADIVGAELTRAKARIVQGRQEVAKHVTGLPRELQRVGKELLAGFEDKFKELVGQVDARRDAIVDSLAEKYVAARDAANERAKAMKEANKGLWDKAKDAIGGVIETIQKLKDMLLGMLAKAAGVIDKIIADPIAFLGNLVAAIKQGLNQFVSNIAKHLKAGLMGWLFGTLAEAGIQLPQSFDLKGILSLVLQLLGVTYANIRARAATLVGEKAISALEKTVDVFKTLATEGVAGIWKFIVDKLTSLKETMLDQIKDFVITKIITAGITWLISMLNPASAFVRACKMIYDVVIFFVERGSQIMGLVNAVLDGIGAIASGVIGGAANLVEQALAKAVPIAISFLASLLGLGGIAGKIKSIIEAIQAPINKAIDAVIGGALKLFKKLGGDKLIKAVQKGITWTKEKIKKAKDWVKKKASQAKDWATSKAKKALGKEKEKEKETAGAAGTDTSEASTRLQAGLAELGSKLDAAAKGGLTPTELSPIVTEVKAKYGFKVLEARERVDALILHGEINPKDDKKKELRKLTVKATLPQARLIENPELRFPRDEAMAIDRAQETMNDLYREFSKYGDASSAFMAMKEQYEGGVGKQPKALVFKEEPKRKQIGTELRKQRKKGPDGKFIPVKNADGSPKYLQNPDGTFATDKSGQRIPEVEMEEIEVPVYEKKGGKDVYETDVKGETIMVTTPVYHYQKCKEYLVTFEAAIGISALPPEAKGRIQAEINKIKTAILWADEYKAGKGPSIPGWVAKKHRAELGG